MRGLRMRGLFWGVLLACFSAPAAFHADLDIPYPAVPHLLSERPEWNQLCLSGHCSAMMPCQCGGTDRQNKIGRAPSAPELPEEKSLPKNVLKQRAMSLGDVREAASEAETVQNKNFWDPEYVVPVVKVKSGGIKPVERTEMCFSHRGIVWKLPYGLNPDLASMDASSRDRHLYIFTEYRSITSFDLQFERTLAQRTQVPLVRLMVESSTRPVVVASNGMEVYQVRRPGRLIVSWISFEQSGLLESQLLYVQHIQKEWRKKHQVTFVLPGWVQLLHTVLPTGLYFPALRRFVEKIVVGWMTISGLWALWQLYQHVELFAAAVRPVVRLMMRRFGMVLGYVDKAMEEFTAKYIHWMKPVDVLVLRLRSFGIFDSTLSRALHEAYYSFWQAVKPLQPIVQQAIGWWGAAVATVYAPLVYRFSPIMYQLRQTTWHMFYPMKTFFDQSFGPTSRTLAALSQRKGSLGQESLRRIASVYFMMLLNAGRGLKRRMLDFGAVFRNVDDIPPEVLTPRRSLSADKRTLSSDSRLVDPPEDSSSRIPWQASSPLLRSPSSEHRHRSQTPNVIDSTALSSDSSPGKEEMGERGVSPGRICVPETRRRLMVVGQHLATSREQQGWEKEQRFCEKDDALYRERSLVREAFCPEEYANDGVN